MPSYKHLNGAAHNILDHAASGLSYLHPHVGQTCRAFGLSQLTLDLLRESPLPESVLAPEPCVFATQTLHRTFVGLLAKLGFNTSDVRSATLTFRASPDPSGDYTLPCICELVTAHGRLYRHKRA